MVYAVFVLIPEKDNAREIQIDNIKKMNCDVLKQKVYDQRVISKYPTEYEFEYNWRCLK
jgi:hypothetical protein